MSKEEYERLKMESNKFETLMNLYDFLKEEQSRKESKGEGWGLYNIYIDAFPALVLGSPPGGVDYLTIPCQDVLKMSLLSMIEALGKLLAGKRGEYLSTDSTLAYVISGGY